MQVLPQHPWRELRALAHVTVHYGHLAPGVWGLSAGDRIWLDSRLLQAERRCTLAHELEHRDRGHDGCQPPSVETEVNLAVARRLIPIGRLVTACRWAHTLSELADELWVDEDSARTRLEHLRPWERAMLDQALEDRH